MENMKNVIDNFILSNKQSQAIALPFDYTQRVDEYSKYMLARGVKFAYDDGGNFLVRIANEPGVSDE